MYAKANKAYTIAINKRRKMTAINILGRLSTNVLKQKVRTGKSGAVAKVEQYLYSGRGGRGVWFESRARYWLI